MVRHWTPKPVIICSIRSSPTGGNFFVVVVKSFEYKIAISANFVQTVKNSNDTCDGYAITSTTCYFKNLTCRDHTSFHRDTGLYLKPGS